MTVEPPQPPQTQLVVEMDERRSFVEYKQQPVWMWLALDRAYRNIIGVAFGDRSAQTYQQLWDALPPNERQRAVLDTDH